MTGPFGTKREARAAALAAMDPDEDSLLTAAGNRKMLGRACEAAGVEMGRYDDRIIEWLSGWEPSACAVVASLIARANQPGAVTLTPGQLEVVLDALADAADYRMRCAAEYCGDCETHPAGACDDHLDDVEAAQKYEALSAGLEDGA